MTQTMVHLTNRVPRELIDKLDELARERRMQTGENVSRADLVREALESLADGGDPTPADPAAPSLLAQAVNCPDKREAMRLALEVIAKLAHDAQQRGLLNGAPQELGMAVWKASEGRGDLELLLDYVSKMHGALRAV